MTLKAMQSYRGKLNYYSKLLKTTPCMRLFRMSWGRCKHARGKQLKDDENTITKEEDKERWARVQVVFAMLKNKVDAASILRHSDQNKDLVIILYAGKWYIQASLVQANEGIFIIYTSPTRNNTEPNCSTL